MADENSEEFRKFILENRDMIESILNEGKEPEPEKEVELTAQEIIDNHKAEMKERAKALNDAMLLILNDDDVQKHFITGCLEFLHFFQSVIDAAPLSPEVREVVDKFEETRDKAIRNAITVGAKDTMENITINDVKKQTSSAYTSTKERLENISIRDIKESIREHTR